MKNSEKELAEEIEREKRLVLAKEEEKAGKALQRIKSDRFFDKLKRLIKWPPNKIELIPKGEERLEKAKKETKKKVGKKMVEEFEKLTEKKARKEIKPVSLNKEIKNKVIKDSLKLLHPIKTAKSKKKVELIFPKKRKK